MTPAVEERKACQACARAKRKCGKESPRCGRCEEKDLDCIYPARRPDRFVLFQPEDANHAETSSTLYEGIASTETSETLALEPGDDSTTGLDIALVPPQRGLGLCTHDIWFLSPETWEIAQIQPVDISQVSSSVLKRYPNEISEWLSQWVSEGANPFVHKELYRYRFPRCVQDAYTALSFFLSQTPSIEEAAHRILQDRAEQLLRDNLSDVTSTSRSGSLDTFNHLARVHALIVYQHLGLFGSDVRLRHLAEQRIPLLFQWATDMLKSASQSTDLCSFLEQITTSDLVLAGEMSTIPTGPPSQTIGEEALWRAWIFAESIRRTWAIAHGIQTMYLTMKQGWAACPGVTKYTIRKGVWDAEFAYTWGKLCSEKEVWFMHQEQMERLFTSAKLEDIDTFGKHVMEIQFGWEKLKRWGNES